MGWFSRGKESTRRVDNLEEDMEKVQRALRTLDLDMHTLYDKVHAALGRISKRAAIIDASTQQEAGDPLEASEASRESPALKKAMREIAIRRGLG